MKYFKRNTHGHARHTFERVMQKKCGFNILVDSPEQCYLSLYAVHDAYRPQPNSFEDGIITPSSNGAQALQTCILSEQGVQIFVQICTHKMYQQQQLGIVSSRSNYGLYGFDALSVNYSTAWMGKHESILQLDGRAILNPGSVGQPRDGDPRASYAIFEPENNTWQNIRVDYDIKGVQKRILKAGLPRNHATRLSSGA